MFKKTTKKPKLVKDFDTGVDSTHVLKAKTSKRRSNRWIPQDVEANSYTAEELRSEPPAHHSSSDSELDNLIQQSIMGGKVKSSIKLPFASNKTTLSKADASVTCEDLLAALQRYETEQSSNLAHQLGQLKDFKALKLKLATDLQTLERKWMTETEKLVLLEELKAYFATAFHCFAAKTQELECLQQGVQELTQANADAALANSLAEWVHWPPTPLQPVLSLEEAYEQLFGEVEEKYFSVQYMLTAVDKWRQTDLQGFNQCGSLLEYFLDFLYALDFLVLQPLQDLDGLPTHAALSDIFDRSEFPQYLIIQQKLCAKHLAAKAMTVARTLNLFSEESTQAAVVFIKAHLRTEVQATVTERLLHCVQQLSAEFPLNCHLLAYTNLLEWAEVLPLVTLIDLAVIRLLVHTTLPVLKQSEPHVAVTSLQQIAGASGVIYSPQFKESIRPVAAWCYFSDEAVLQAVAQLLN